MHLQNFRIFIILSMMPFTNDKSNNCKNNYFCFPCIWHLLALILSLLAPWISHLLCVAGVVNLLYERMFYGKVTSRCHYPSTSNSVCTVVTFLKTMHKVNLNEIKVIFPHGTMVTVGLHSWTLVKSTYSVFYVAPIWKPGLIMHRQVLQAIKWICQKWLSWCLWYEWVGHHNICTQCMGQCCGSGLLCHLCVLNLPHMRPKS